MGRGPFFGGARKMRGFPMNLSPGGMDDGPPGFPYFDGKFEFGYGGPPFHPHDGPFFAGHPGGPMPFNVPGKGHLCMYYDSTIKQKKINPNQNTLLPTCTQSPTLL